MDEAAGTSDPPLLAPGRAAPAYDLSAPELYLNRELTWLSFNRRVIAEAEDPRNPLLERVKFLAISASNLDEFFMKRIGGLKQQVASGVQELTPDGHTPRWQIERCYELVREQERLQQQIVTKLREELRTRGIEILQYSELSSAERAAMRQQYCANVFPLVTPLAIDPAHPFPFVSNLSLNLLISMRGRANVIEADGQLQEPSLFRVKVAVSTDLPRFQRVGASARFVPLDQVIAHNLDLLFPGGDIASAELFRVTRNANTEKDEEEADDLLAMIETELRDRRVSPIVRLEVASNFDPARRGMLAAELGLDERADVFECAGMLELRDLMELVALDFPELRDPPHHPADQPELAENRSIFHIIRDASAIMMIHPYESFSTSVERFLREASVDPKVRAIKMTLYRTSHDASLLEYLFEAARNGKQVAVVVELKARFDEAANIRFATRLEDYGIHVNYGVIGLKTHCKVILVVRQDYNGLRRYAHIGTGNYHPGTARIYSDIGLLTADPQIGADLTELLNYLTTGYGPGRAYRKLLAAPVGLKRGLLERIDREIAVKKKSSAAQALIRFKMNALDDRDIVCALYRASQAGVKIELIVRDTCRLRPGLPGISENIQVVSIVGRFLEHSRIYYFRNGGNEEYFIGSADCMTRNLESRVEVLAPVEDPELRQELRGLLDLQMQPNRCRWVMHSDGSYTRDSSSESCQQVLIGMAERESLQKPRRGRRRFARRGSRPQPLIDSSK